jgi:hypothetical protein
MYASHVAMQAAIEGVQIFGGYIDYKLFIQFKGDTKYEFWTD